MGQTTEELNTQIADTRESLASDLDALQDRVSPGAADDSDRTHRNERRTLDDVDQLNGAGGVARLRLPRSRSAQRITSGRAPHYITARPDGAERT